MSSPSKYIFPLSGFSKPAIILRSVDFPQPEEPSRLNNSDFDIFKLTLSKAKVEPNFFDTSFISRKELDMIYNKKAQPNQLSCAFSKIYIIEQL